MKKKRVIPILLLKNGWLVQSQHFQQYRNLGNPITSVERLSNWASDELIYLNISKNNIYDMNRDDQGYPNRHSFFEIIQDVAKKTFMPITVGGGIKTISDIDKLLSAGADKVSINSKALEDKNFINQSAKEFGSQCIIISIDVKIINNEYTIMSHGGTQKTQYKLKEWGQTVESLGAGEILLNSIDRDGMKNGYDIKLLNEVSKNVKIPVIACGGAGEWSHFAEALDKTKVDAVAAANVFQHIDQSVYLAKQYLHQNGYNVRPPDLLLDI